MKKILSIILCGLFLNLVYCPMIFALEETATPVTETQETNTYNTTGNGIGTNGVTSPNQGVNEGINNISEINSSSVNNTVYTPTKTEHIQIRKNNSKKINVESVYISSHNVEIPAQDILQIAFVNDFNGRKARIGDTIEFRFPNDIVTQEGTMIIPSTARIVAEITNLKKPKPFHLCGKVYLNFKYIEINGTRKPIEAKLFSKKDYLSRKTLNKTEAVGETAVATGAGFAAGAAICAATAADAAVIVFGTAITAGVGAIVGAAVGILLPGASFKAKAGQRVNIQLTEELDI